MKMESKKENPIAKRTFRSALIELFEREYKLIGSHKVIELIADDICQLRDEFYPRTGEAYGNVSWVTTSVENKKPKLGQRVEDYKNVRLSLPLVSEEDLKMLGSVSSAKRDKAKIVRLINSAYEQGGLLTVEELALLINRSVLSVSKRINEYQQEHQVILPIKGNKLDIGPGITHKRIILELYEKKVAAPDIARQVNHSQEAVDRYIKDYERVKFLVRRGMDITEISHLTGRGKQVIKQYVKILQRYHPELFKSENPEKSLETEET
ncbi:MAG: DUF1670 domain-containing protein [Deltaproteobacteria bacterium]|nr:DUF1670 domain-containing protein [Deltaproteobacteria bacterium]